jgi:hypothetical protein
MSRSRSSAKKSVKRRSVKPAKKSVKRRSVKPRYSVKSCPKGSVSRKTFVRKSGVKVSASCVKSKSLRSKGKKPQVYLPKLKQGALTKHGYSIHESTKMRHSAIKKAMKEFTPGQLVKKLNAVRVLSKNTSPENSAIYAKDIKYIEEKWL